MFRFNINRQRVTVAGHSMNESLINSSLAQQFLLFRAMLLRPLFKVQVMEDTDGLPEICFLSISKLLRIPAQDIPHNASVFLMKFTLIVFAE